MKKLIYAVFHMDFVIFQSILVSFRLSEFMLSNANYFRVSEERYEYAKRLKTAIQDLHEVKYAALVSIFLCECLELCNEITFKRQRCN